MFDKYNTVCCLPQALQQMADENNGTIVCPRSRQTFNIRDAEKVFVMWEGAYDTHKLLTVKITVHLINRFLLLMNIAIIIRNSLTWKISLSIHIVNFKYLLSFC